SAMTALRRNHLIDSLYWAVCAVVVLVVHAGVAAALFHRQPVAPAPAAPPALLLDLAPLPAAPQLEESDVPPAPEVMEASIPPDTAEPIDAETPDVVEVETPEPVELEVAETEAPV